MTATFGRLLSAMVTPFDKDGALDLDTAQKLAVWLVKDQGHEGLVLAGTTGESPTLTHDEQGDLFRAVREAVSVPLIAGTGSNDTSAAIDLTKRAVKAGIDGLLVVTPYYNRPSQRCLKDHFTQVAAAGDGLPTLIYDIPFRTGRKVETETLAALCNGVENIIGIKDAAGDVAETARLMSMCSPDMEVYSGEDKLSLALLALGAVGVIGVATHWTGPEHLELFERLEAGDLAAARALNTKMLASFAFESTDAAPNPIPTKAVLRALGHNVGYGRAPMHLEPEGFEASVRDLLTGSGLKAEALL